MWYVYICEKGSSLYTGITTDLKNRLRQHGKPKLIYSKKVLNRDAAVKLEKQIKGWRRSKKLALAMANSDK